jgi:amino acid permease
MSRSTRTAGLSPVWVTSLSSGLVAILAAVLGHTAIAEVMGGGVIIFVAFLCGRRLTRRLAAETNPGRELVWNVLLVLVIVLALVGVGVMGAAIPESP